MLYISLRLLCVYQLLLFLTRQTCYAFNGFTPWRSKKPTITKQDIERPNLDYPVAPLWRPTSDSVPVV